MEKLQLLDTLTEIDMECNKINAIISNLLNSYEVADGKEPQITALASKAVNSKPGTSGYNTFNFISGDNEIMQFIRIVFDYITEISNRAKQAVSQDT